ncbi:IclR family transcriptional regulator [bacterium]|nr:IclR family transcriptional regulator [bacterium]
MKERSDYYNQSIKRAALILNTLGSQNKELGISELSRLLDLHKSTVHRMLVTLEDENLVVYNKTLQKYHLGIKLLELGSIAKRQIDIRNIAWPIMQEIAQKTKENVDLNILIDDRRVSIEKIESPHDLRRAIKLGKSLPLYHGGSGKAILAFLPDSEIERILQKADLAPLGPNAITNPGVLKEHLKEIREKGYATSFEERVLGVASIAAPILNEKHYAIASLSISGPIARLTKEKEPLFAMLIKKAASDISKNCGYSINIRS